MSGEEGRREGKKGGQGKGGEERGSEGRGGEWRGGEWEGMRSENALMLACTHWLHILLMKNGQGLTGCWGGM